MSAPELQGPAAPDPPGPGPAPRPRKVKPLVRRALRLYRSVNKLDRSGGGGFGLSTLVKLAGWAGLIAVLAVLAVRVRRIQEQLDPVANGVARLGAEIESARAAVRSDSSRAKEQLEQLERDALELRKLVEHQAELDARASQELTAAGGEARRLVEQLEKDVGNAEELQGEHARAQGSMRAFAQSIEAGRTGLEAGTGKLAAGQQAVSDSLQKVQQRTADLEKDLGALGVKPAKAALDRVEADAKTLAEALEKTTAHASALDAALVRKLEEAQRAARREEPVKPARAAEESGAAASSRTAAPAASAPAASPPAAVVGAVPPAPSGAPAH